MSKTIQEMKDELREDLKEPMTEIGFYDEAFKRKENEREYFFGDDEMEKDKFFKDTTRSKYHHEITDSDGNEAIIDVYDVLITFDVTNPAIAHAVKKLLAGGQRGYKDTIQDYEEAIESIKRAVELER